MIRCGVSSPDTIRCFAPRMALLYRWVWQTISVLPPSRGSERGTQPPNDASVYAIRRHAGRRAHGKLGRESRVIHERKPGGAPRSLDSAPHRAYIGPPLPQADEIGPRQARNGEATSGSA